MTVTACYLEEKMELRRTMPDLRSRGASFSTSSGGLAVYPLWKGNVEDALEQLSTLRPRLRRNLAIAAVLPTQTLDLKDLDAMEEAGLLVLQVQPEASKLPDSDLLAFIEREIDYQEAGFSDQQDAPSAYASSAYEEEDVSDVTLESADEDSLLQSINDPEADEGFA